MAQQSSVGVENSDGFSLAFAQMCNTVAIAGSSSSRSALEHLVQQTVLLTPSDSMGTASSVQDELEALFGIRLVESEVSRAVDALERRGGLVRSGGHMTLPQQVRADLAEQAKEAAELEVRVRESWQQLLVAEYPELNPDTAWEALQRFLVGVFRRHGIMAVLLLDPNRSNLESHVVSLDSILRSAVEGTTSSEHFDSCSHAVAGFLNSASQDRDRTRYVTMLADTAYAYYLFSVAPEASEQFRMRLEGLTIFFDTNVLFGVLDLNSKTSTISSQLISIIRKNGLPFRLRYHEETLNELRFTVELQAERLQTRRHWGGEVSRAAAKSGRLDGLELRYHERNAESPISVDAFLRPLQHLDVLLREQGLDIYRTDGVRRDRNVADAVKYEYQAFLDEFGYEKAMESVDHDASVLADVYSICREQHSSSLALGALFVTFDYRLRRFEARYARDSGLRACSVVPETMLQVIRPYLASTNDFDAAFAESFRLQEFRIAAAGQARNAAAKALDLMAGYEGISEETAARMLASDLLLSGIGAAETADEARECFEHALEEDHSRLSEENELLRQQQARDRRATAERLDRLEAQLAQERKLRRQVETKSESLVSRHREREERTRQEMSSEIRDLRQQLQEFEHVHSDTADRGNPSTASRIGAENTRLRYALWASLGLVLLLAAWAADSTWQLVEGLAPESILAFRLSVAVFLLILPGLPIMADARWKVFSVLLIPIFVGVLSTL